MVVLCWSVKGGSGTSVVAAALALLECERASRVTAIDLAGDLPAVFGLAEPTGPGVGDWLSSGAEAGALHRIAVTVTGPLSLVPAGEFGAAPTGRWEALAEALAGLPHPVVVDAGTTPAPPAALRRVARHDLLVLRPDYLALRRAAQLSHRPSGLVLVHEVGRALRRADVEQAAGAPVVAELQWDPAVARAVDAGLLAGRLPRALRPLAPSASAA